MLLFLLSDAEVFVSKAFVGRDIVVKGVGGLDLGMGKVSLMLFLIKNVSYQMLFTESKNIARSQSYFVLNL